MTKPKSPAILLVKSSTVQKHKEPGILVYLHQHTSEKDSWFAPPVHSEKQLDYMEQETHIKQQQYQETHTDSVESEDIHQKMYEIATRNQSTTLHLNPPGGSENYQSGPDGWSSGTGYNQYR